MSADEARTPLVTVYIANHNYGRFIEQAIQSVLQQPLRDFELIIIDDGSSNPFQAQIVMYRPQHFLKFPWVYASIVSRRNCYSGSS